MRSSVSIIIPAKNAASTIGASLYSLAADRAVIRECLLVDDGSADGTADTAKTVAEELGLTLTVIEADFGNAGASRNAGMARAGGDSIFFLDADDEVVAGGLTTLVQCLQSNPDAGVAAGGYVRRIRGQADKVRVPKEYSRNRTANAASYLKNKLRTIPIGSALVRRTALGRIRFPETLQYEEDVLFWSAFLTANDVITTSELVMVYNVDEARSLDRFTAYARSQFLNFSKELGKLKAFGIEDRVLKWRKCWIAYRIARSFLKIGDRAAARRFIRIASACPRLLLRLASGRYLLRGLAYCAEACWIAALVKRGRN